MLKTRVISSIVGLILLVGVVLAGQIALGIAVFVLAVIGLHEFYKSVEHSQYKPIKLIGYLSCLPIILIGLNGVTRTINNYFELFKSVNYASFLVFVIIVVLLSLIIFLHDRYNLNDIAITVFGILYVAFFFSFIILTRNLNNGNYFIWMIFIGAWATDTFAYFAGVNFGKTKFLPVISPKKSVEGSIGGIAGCILAMSLYGFWLNAYHFKEVAVPLYHFVLIGLLCGILSQIGDWSASAIKRYVGIKDYGSIMPGHGGVLDRFDSILFCAPVIYFYISFVILG